VVWQHHFGNIPDGLVIRHKCDNPRCVEIDHLEIGTRHDNVRDMVERNRQCRGERKPCAKLTWALVAEIRERLDRGEGVRSLGREFGVDHSVISEIKNNKAWVLS
jgi:hypothetical protein